MKTKEKFRLCLGIVFLIEIICGLDHLLMMLEGNTFYLGMYWITPLVTLGFLGISIYIIMPIFFLITGDKWY